MKGIDLLILLVLALVIFFVLRSLWRQRKQGGCAYCPNKEQCSSCAKVPLELSPKPRESKDQDLS